MIIMTKLLTMMYTIY